MSLNFNFALYNRRIGQTLVSLPGKAGGFTSLNYRHMAVITMNLLVPVSNTSFPRLMRMRNSQ